MFLFVSLFTKVCDVIKMWALCWVVVVPCGGGGSVVGLELRRCAFLVASIMVFLAGPGIFGLVWGPCWRAVWDCPNLACGFCFATGSSVWCHGGLGQSAPPVLNVLPYLFFVNFKTTADTT